MKRSIVVGVLVVVIMLVSLPSWSAVIYVRPGGSDGNDGKTWYTAKLSVVAAANTAVSGDEIWVAAGTYTGPLRVKNGVSLYGGFKGDETQREQRDWTKNVSVLQMQPGSYGVVVSVAIGTPVNHSITTIDGFTIRNSHCAIFFGNSSPTIANNTIIGLNSNSPYSSLAAIHGGNSISTIINNKIIGNRGGAIELIGGSGTISGNTIASNTVTSPTGMMVIGGVRCENGCTANISNNLIKGNSGSGIGVNNSSVTIKDNTIIGNYLPLRDTPPSPDSLIIRGGGICFMNSAMVISGNKIIGNKSLYGGGIYCAKNPTSTAPEAIIYNNIICGNGAYQGGGISCVDGVPVKIINNTITGNSAEGIYFGYNRLFTIANNIIVYNGSSVGGGYSLYGQPPSFRNNCIFGNRLWDDLSNIYPDLKPYNVLADPKLANAPYGKLHIQPDSPCIDAGDDSVIQPEWLDMDAQARLAGDHVDIGADESDGTSWDSAPCIVRVSPSGNDINDGSTWDKAKKTVQSAIDAASALGGEVWVAKGTYAENLSLPPFVYLYGGFSGSETEKDQRDWTANAAVLDGTEKGSVITVQGGELVTSIDGFTITGGKADSGGGINCLCSSSCITNNIITGNSSTGQRMLYSDALSSYPASGGGGIYCAFSGSIISNNSVSRNDAVVLGGGVVATDIYFRQGLEKRFFGKWQNLPLVVSNNIIENNKASHTIITKPYGCGGGIYCEGAKIVSNIIRSNTSSYTGGGIQAFYGNSIVANNLITGNSANMAGGGIDGINCLLNNTIAQNTALNGGGICYNTDNYYYSPTLNANNLIAFNSSGVYSPYSNWYFEGFSNCVHGNTDYNFRNCIDSTGKNGNISVDPLFVDMAAGDYRIKPDSPCINAGINEVPSYPYGALYSFLNLYDKDIEGQGRICWEKMDIGVDEYWPVKVQIDVKPGEYPNQINLRSKGMVYVAVLSTPSFDAKTVDVSTVRFASAPVVIKGGKPAAAYADVDMDGDIDLVLGFVTPDLVIASGATEAAFTGRVSSGDYIEGTDNIIVKN